jgi:hypothetical protein
VNSKKNYYFAEEENFEEYAGDILEKGRKMLDWYQMLLLDESMVRVYSL